MVLIKEPLLGGHNAHYFFRPSPLIRIRHVLIRIGSRNNGLIDRVYDLCLIVTLWLIGEGVDGVALGSRLLVVRRVDGWICRVWSNGLCGFVKTLLVCH
jgi:hypothetical protein